MAKDIDRAQVVSSVIELVPNHLVPSLFPERKALWDSISQCDELKKFIDLQIDKYLNLYDKHSKGREKYATLFLSWLDVIRSFTCKSQQTPAALADWSPVLAKSRVTASETTQSTVLATILQGIQENIQAQMATKIATLEVCSFAEEKPSDHTALYRISGWAVKSAIDHRSKRLKNIKEQERAQVEEEIDLLKSLRRSKIAKITHQQVPNS